jgi:thymidine kinase
MREVGSGMVALNPKLFLRRDRTLIAECEIANESDIFNFNCKKVDEAHFYSKNFLKELRSCALVRSSK